MNSDPAMRRFRKYSPGLLIATGLLALSACSSGSSAGVSAESGITTTQPSPDSTSQDGTMLTFDDLGGGSPIIEVYPGVQDTPADKKYNGTFNSGDTALAECRTDGREVHSNPAVGEEDRSSNQWIRIDGAPGQIEYATAVYVQNPEALLRQLQDC